VLVEDDQFMVYIVCVILLLLLLVPLGFFLVRSVRCQPQLLARLSRGLPAPVLWTAAYRGLCIDACAVSSRLLYSEWPGGRNAVPGEL